jgi:predicted ATPase/DNA-binding SARP family transcriptional activator
LSQLTLLLLGSPSIQVDSAEVGVDTRKAVALIAYLAVTEQRQSRDTLAALLWPDYSQTNARAALRRTLSTLNKALGGEHLIIGREALGLDTANVVVDAQLFPRHIAECLSHGHSPSEVCRLCVAPLTKAVELYRGDFLSGFALRDSPDFDDWQISQAENLRRGLALALERLAQAHAALANFDTAIDYAMRWLSLDRLNEPAHRYLMLLNMWTGRRAAMLQQYRECVRTLQADLGVAPLEATTQLYNDLKENRIPGPPAPLAEAGAEQGPTAPEAAQARTPLHQEQITPANASSVQPAEVPMVGRDDVWEVLTGGYNALEHRGRVFAISGEAGIGKTRLAEEFVAYARGRGAATLAARCYEGEATLAYGPVVEALRAAVRLPESEQRLAAIPATWLGEVTRLLPEIALQNPRLSPPPPLDNPGAQGRFFEGVRQAFLTLLGGSAPGVLFFDDVHWADGASLDLLIYLARRLHDMPVCLLLTWRTEEVLANSGLAALVAEAQRNGEAGQLTLSRLGPAEVGELVRSTGLGGEQEGRSLAERLYNETEGLPFFIVEYLAALSRAGREAGDGLLDEGREAKQNWLLPGGIRNLLTARLRHLDQAGLQILSTAAVIGRSFDFDTLQAASGRSEEESIAALEQLIAARLVAEIGGGKPPGGARTRDLSVDLYSPTYDFSHEKLRNLVYEETSLARRRLLHRRIAEAFIARLRTTRDAGALAGQIAHHCRMAGQEDVAAEYYRQAGDHARTLYANAEALAHLSTALALGHPEAEALHEAIGDLQTLTGEYGTALISYETAAALSEGVALAELEHKLGIVHGRRGDWARAESHLEEALASYGEEGPAGPRARVYADWSLTVYHYGDTARAITLATRAFELAQGAGDMRAEAQAHNMLGILATRRGDLVEAESNLAKSLLIAEKLADPTSQVAALNNLSLAYASSGEWGRAQELAEKALSLSAAQGDRPREAAIHSNLADLYHAAGRSHEAMFHLKQAVGIYAEIGVEAGDVQPAIWRLTEW